jgi:hypothetical protein
MQDEEGPVLFEFVVVLKGDPHAIQRLSDTFSLLVCGIFLPFIKIKMQKNKKNILMFGMVFGRRG